MCKQLCVSASCKKKTSLSLYLSLTLSLSLFDTRTPPLCSGITRHTLSP